MDRSDVAAGSDATSWDALRYALGGLVITFGELEAHVAATLWAFLGIEGNGAAVITSRLGFRANVDILARFFEMEDDDRFRPLKARLESVAQRRDQFIHSMWDPADQQEPGQPIAVRLKWSRAGNLDGEEVLVEAVEQLVTDIWTLYVEIEQLP